MFATCLRRPTKDLPAAATDEYPRVPRTTAIDTSDPIAIPISEYVVRLKIREKTNGLNGFYVTAMKYRLDLAIA